MYFLLENSLILKNVASAHSILLFFEEACRSNRVISLYLSVVVIDA